MFQHLTPGRLPEDSWHKDTTFSPFQLIFCRNSWFWGENTVFFTQNLWGRAYVWGGSNERSDVATPQAVSGLMDFRLRKWSTEGVKKHKLFEERSSEFLCFSLTFSIFTEIRAAGELSLFRFFLSWERNEKPFAAWANYGSPKYSKINLTCRLVK